MDRGTHGYLYNTVDDGYLFRALIFSYGTQNLFVMKIYRHVNNSNIYMSNFFYFTINPENTCFWVPFSSLDNYSLNFFCDDTCVLLNL